MIEIKKISDVFDVGSSKRVFKSEWTSEGVPFYRAREVVKLSKNGYVENELFISNEMFEEYSEKYGVPREGDILVTGVGTLGACYQVKANDKFYFKDGNIIWLKKREEVSSDYIEYCFKSPFVKRQIAARADGATVGTYTISNAKETEIPLPPLEQQKKIAAILDAADAYRQKTKALIAKYDELTQSLFLDMFGDPVTNPKGWEEKKLEELSHLTTKGESPKWQGYEYIDSGARFVTSENVRLGYLDCSKDKFVAEEFHEKLKRSQLKENDLLVNLVGASIGRGALVSREILPANINQAVAKTELNVSLLNPIFALNLVITPQIQDRLIGNKVEGARANVSLKNVRELRLYVPPMELQNQFAESVQAIETQKAQAQASLEKAEELFNSLLQRAFKGELTN